MDIFEMVKTNAVVELSQAIREGIKIDQLNNRYWTPLMEACLKDHFTIATFLITAGANVNARNLNGETPMMIAAYHKHISLAEYLIECGADVNVQDGEGVTPLMDACQNGSFKMAKILVKAGAYLNAKNNEGHTALQIAKTKKSLSSILLFQKYKNCLVISDLEILDTLKFKVNFKTLRTEAEEYKWIS